MTRISDRDLGLRERTRMANQWDADVFLFEWMTIELGALGLRGSGWVLGRLQSGQVRLYAAVALLSVVAALAYLALS